MLFLATIVKKEARLPTSTTTEAIMNIAEHPFDLDSLEAVWIGPCEPDRADEDVNEFIRAKIQAGLLHRSVTIRRSEVEN